jgi:hypothetical protein
MGKRTIGEQAENAANPLYTHTVQLALDSSSGSAGKMQMLETQKPNHPGPAVAGMAGMAGQGFLLLAKEQGWHLPDPLIWIIGGFSVVALIISGWIYARWLWQWLKVHISARSNARHGLILWMLGAIGIAGLTLLGAAVVGVIAYVNSESAILPLERTATSATAAATPITNGSKSALLPKRYYSSQNKEEVSGRLDRISSIINKIGGEILEQAEVAINRSPWDRPGEDITPFIERMDRISNLTVEMHKALYDELVDKEREYRVEVNDVLFPKEPFINFQIAGNEFRNGLSVWKNLKDTSNNENQHGLLRLVMASRMSFAIARDKLVAWLTERQQIINQTRMALRGS